MKNSLTPVSVDNQSKQTFDALNKNHHVVLIDSNDIDLFINQKILEQSGITNVIAFKNPTEALTYLQETTTIYRLILIDIYLFGMDGFEFIDKFQQLNLHLKHKEICLLSASLNPVHFQKSLQYKTRYIEKPLSTQKLTTQ